MSEAPVVVDLDAAIAAAERAGRYEVALITIAQALTDNRHPGLHENLRKRATAALAAVGLDHLVQ